MVGTLLVSADSGHLAAWIISLASGVGIFAISVRFVYSVEDERRVRAGRDRPGLLDVILPRFPALLASLLVLIVWFGVFLLGPFDTGAGTLFLVLLGFSFALIIGKGVQRVLDEVAANREPEEPPEA
jgi:hypothetical protein